MDEVWAALPVANGGVIGLTGIAVSPDYSDTKHVYVAGTFARQDDSLLSRTLGRVSRFIARQFDEEAGFPYENRVYRMTDDGTHGTNPELILGGLPADLWYGTIALEFGPDGFLYITNGYAGSAEVAASTNSHAGKVLRYLPDGDSSLDGPEARPTIYADGFRQAQGIAWHPENGDLFLLDHGSDGNDEFNHVIAGNRYGWPELAGISDEPEYVNPILVWTPSIAPSGLSFVSQETHPWFGSAIVGALAGESLKRLELAGDGDRKWTVMCEETIALGQFGRIRAVTSSDDGKIIFSTSNRDLNGHPRPNDDRVIELRILN